MFYRIGAAFFDTEFLMILRRVKKLLGSSTTWLVARDCEWSRTDCAGLILDGTAKVVCLRKENWLTSDLNVDACVFFSSTREVRLGF